MGHDVVPLFERHGIPRPLGYWHSFAGSEPPLYAYLLQWPDLDQRMKAAGFYSDPDWLTQCGQMQVRRWWISELMMLRPSSAWAATAQKANPPCGRPAELRMQHVSTRCGSRSSGLGQCGFAIFACTWGNGAGCVHVLVRRGHAANGFGAWLAGFLKMRARLSRL